MKLICFGHKSRVGKDTAAKFLTTQLRMRKQGINVQSVSFAALLKRVTHEIFKWAGVKPGEHYEAHPEERAIKIPAIGKDIVELWVAVGESMVAIHPLVWVNSLFENHKNADVLIIPDLRRIPEAEAVGDRGGIKIKIIKLDAPLRDTVTDNYLNDYDKWDEIIENNGSMNELYDKIGALIDKYELLK